VLLELFLGLLPAVPAPAAYLCAGLLLFASGLGGVGFAQDILLLALAALTLNGPLHAAVLAPVAWLAILAGDAMSLWIGHRYGARWIRRPWAARIVAPQRLPRLEEGMRRYAALFSFLTRFLPGQRGVLFFLAGSLRMPWRPFLLADGLAAALQVPVFLYGVQALGWDWRRLQGPVDQADNVLTGLLLVVLVGAWAMSRRARA
jgi:membrane protein DedA with SNARE-associated domain